MIDIIQTLQVTLYYYYISFTLESEEMMKYCHVICLYELSTYFKFPCTIGFVGYKSSVINLNPC